MPGAPSKLFPYRTERGEEKALTLFHDAATRVPAYKDFLKKAGISHATIKTIADFARVPLTDAKNYIAAYPLEKRCWDGKLSGANLIATSSGTTGEPKFWPRSVEQESEAVAIHQKLYSSYFGIDKRTTLLLIGFPMGVYVSGMATALPSWIAAQKNPGMTVMSIGNNKAEMLRAVRHLSAAYDQTILVGHPFFIKDIIETGAAEGISWAQKNLGLMFCSEGFSEDWREYLRKQARIPKYSMRIFNTYGSSEMLLMGYESPLSIRLKRLLERDRDALIRTAHDTLPPQLFHYDPSLRYIESVDRELIFTSASGIPLIRFNLHDRGNIINSQELFKGLSAAQKDSLRLAGPLAPDWRLPLITLFGRSDQTIIFYAANIYPEHIRSGLNTALLLKSVTGKFCMQKKYLKNMDESLEINVELRERVKPSVALADAIRDRVFLQLQKVNMEYKFLCGNLDKDIVPRIKLFPYGDEKYFKRGLKPRYILQS